MTTHATRYDVPFYVLEPVFGTRRFGVYDARDRRIVELGWFSDSTAALAALDAYVAR